MDAYISQTRILTTSLDAASVVSPKFKRQLRNQRKRCKVIGTGE
jgi:hypothetical protein